MFDSHTLPPNERFAAKVRNTEKTYVEVGRLDKINVRYTFRQEEYTRAVRQYLLAGNFIKKRDFFILPLLLIILLSALFYSRFNQWVLLLTLLCLAAVLLICQLFFFKPQRDYTKKPHIQGEIQLSFTEDGVIFPSETAKSAAAREKTQAENTNTLIAQQQTQIIAAADAEVAPENSSVGAGNPITLNNQVNKDSDPAMKENPENHGSPETAAGSQEPGKGLKGRKGLLAQRIKQQRKQEKETTASTKTRHPGMLKWDSFIEAWENREFFFLIQQPHIYYIVPKHSFVNQEELQYFLKMLYRRVGIVESVAPYRKA